MIHKTVHVPGIFQIMVLMVLGFWEEENQDLVNFAGGLCVGAGVEQGACGILTGGMGILAMFAQKDKARLSAMQEAYLDFFKGLPQTTQGLGCKDIAGDAYPQSNPETCGRLLLDSFSQLMSILVENEFDPED